MNKQNRNDYLPIKNGWWGVLWRTVLQGIMVAELYFLSGAISSEISYRAIGTMTVYFLITLSYWRGNNWNYFSYLKKYFLRNILGCREVYWINYADGKSNLGVQRYYYSFNLTNGLKNLWMGRPSFFVVRDMRSFVAHVYMCDKEEGSIRVERIPKEISVSYYGDNVTWFGIALSMENFLQTLYNDNPVHFVHWNAGERFVRNRMRERKVFADTLIQVAAFFANRSRNAPSVRENKLRVRIEHVLALNLCPGDGRDVSLAE